MRLPAAVAAALAVVALAGAAATLPAATTDAPAGPSTPPAGPGTPPTPTPAPGTPPGQSDPAGEDLDDECLVGCTAGSSLLDRLPSLPGVDSGPLALLVAAALVGLAVVAYRATGDEGAAPADAGRDEPAVPMGRRAAGPRPTPADAAATNDVYRAWRDLTGRLDVPGVEARTPAELAAAAVEAGADGAAVRELRRLFVAVRYGGRPPTPDREERALAAGRRAGSGLEGSTDDSTTAADDSTDDADDSTDDADDSTDGSTTAADDSTDDSTPNSGDSTDDSTTAADDAGGTDG